MSDTLQNQVKAKWIEMLKSGEYEQTAGRFVRDIYSAPSETRRWFKIIKVPAKKIGTSYCAIGLLHEAAAQLLNKHFTENNTPPYSLVAGLGIFKDPKKAVEIIKKVNPKQAYKVYIETYERGLTVAHLNDMGFSFKDIAAVVEEVPLYGRNEEMPSTVGSKAVKVLEPA